MVTWYFLSALVACVVVAGPSYAVDKITPAVHEELAQSWEDLGRQVRDWLGGWREHFAFPVPREERPLISTMLRHREKLGLSEGQARQLEQLRDNFHKESIRKEADLRVAEMDLKALLEAESVDMRKVEEKIREIERLKGDLRLARIRAIEKGKEQLTADQRKKLQEMLSDQRMTRSHFWGER
ncbi:MAG TPA: periplasmic heavy metal sensor [Candidatus Eisenbacteria bacterium]|nr:periplasmic heavy metal sensor [Candidatus Eisenbacteria bacterium]